MAERLQKLLAAAGLCSRRMAEEWISAGRVCVNGAPATLGDRADPETDTITVDGLTGTMKWDATREPDKNAKAMVFAADGTTSLLG